MSPYSANPLIHQYDLMKELGISYLDLEDQYIEFPSLKNVIRWIFGKPLKVLYRRGISYTVVESFLHILDSRRSREEEEYKDIKNKVKF